MPKPKKVSLREGNNGFTLIEVAIILVLIGLLIGLGASLIGPLTKRVKVQDTRERIDAAVESVLGFAVATKRLPNGTEFQNYVRNPVDAWGKPLRYVVWENFTLNEPNVICPSNATFHGFNVTVETANGNRTISNVAFLIISSGPNYNLQTRFGNVTNNVWYVNATNETITIYLPGAKADDFPEDVNLKEDYDDIVKWVTVYELMQRVCYGEQTGDEGPLRIITYSLPIGKQNEYYYAEIIAVGGVPFNQNNEKQYNWTHSITPSNPNLTFTPQNNTLGKFLQITGSPSCPGSYQINVNVTDNKSNTASRTFTLSIQPDHITFTPVSGTTWYATNGSYFNASITITGGRPYFNATGNYYYYNTNCSEFYTNSTTCMGLTCFVSNSNSTYRNDTIIIYGTPNVSDTTTCKFNINVKDSCSMNASARYSVIINILPSGSGSGGGGGGGGGGGAQIAIVNETGSYVFYQKGTDGTCNQVSNRNCIVVNQGETIRIYRNQGQCQSPNQNPSCSFTYDQLKSFDSNNDGNIRLQPNCIIDDNPTVYCI